MGDVTGESLGWDRVEAIVPKRVTLGEFTQPPRNRGGCLVYGSGRSRDIGLIA